MENIKNYEKTKDYTPYKVEGKPLYNKFEIAQMKIDKGDNKLAFLHQLLNSQNAENKGLVSAIRNLIRKITTSVAKLTAGTIGAVVMLPFSVLDGLHKFVSKDYRRKCDEAERRERDRYAKMGKEYPEKFDDFLYTNTKKFKDAEAALLTSLGVTAKYFGKDIQDSYRAITDSIKHKYAQSDENELKRILSTVDLSENRNFLVDDKEVAVIKGAENLIAFKEHKARYESEHPDYISREVRIFDSRKNADGIPYMFLDATNELVKDFLSEDIVHKQNQNLENEPSSEAALEKIEAVLDKYGLSRPKNINYRKTLFSSDALAGKTIPEIVKEVKDTAPELLKELAVMISVSTDEKNNHLINQDDNCYYVKLPSTKKETVIAIPKDSDYRITKNGLLITINMGDTFPVVDKETLNPVGKNISCADMIILNKFEPTDIRRFSYIGDTVEIDGKALQVKNIGGIQYGIDTSNPDNPYAIVVRSITDKHKIEIKNDVVVGDKVIPVTEIANDAFAGTEVREITLSENVSRIDDNAFYGCAGLQAVHSKNKNGVNISDTAFDHEIKVFDVKEINKSTPQAAQSTDIVNDTSGLGLERAVAADASIDAVLNSLDDVQIDTNIVPDMDMKYSELATLADTYRDLRGSIKDNIKSLENAANDSKFDITAKKQIYDVIKTEKDKLGVLEERINDVDDIIDRQRELEASRGKGRDSEFDKDYELQENRSFSAQDMYDLFGDFTH